MKNIIHTLLFSSLMLIVMGCKKDTHQLNEAFTLHFNQSANVIVDGTECAIKFVALHDESRCPPDVDCIWAGQVAVKIRVDKDNDFIIGHHTVYPSSVQYKNRSISLLEVTYDKKKHFGKEKYCSIKLRVE